MKVISQGVTHGSPTFCLVSGEDWYPVALTGTTSSLPNLEPTTGQKNTPWLETVESALTIKVGMRQLSNPIANCNNKGRSGAGQWHNPIPNHANNKGRSALWGKWCNTITQCRDSYVSVLIFHPFYLSPDCLTIIPSL